MTHKTRVRAQRKPADTQTAMWPDQSPGALDDVLASVMARLGITERLTYERREIPLADITIPGRNRLRAVAGYARNFKVVGVLHDPAVMPITGSDGYLAIFGRRRLAGAALAGETHLWVRVYPSLDQRIVSFLRLSEQRRRGNVWIDECEAVIDVVDDRVALTDQELAYALGVDRRTIREYLQIAHLPFLLRELVLSGDLTLGTVRIILRMPEEQQRLLDERAATSEPIDAAIVKQLQQQRYNSALVQVALEIPTSPPLPHQAEDGTPLSPEALLCEALQLRRSVELFQRALADFSPANQTRITVGCRMLLQELDVLERTYAAPVPLGGAA